MTSINVAFWDGTTAGTQQEQERYREHDVAYEVRMERGLDERLPWIDDDRKDLAAYRYDLDEALELPDRFDNVNLSYANDARIQYSTVERVGHRFYERPHRVFKNARSDRPFKVFADLPDEAGNWYTAQLRDVLQDEVERLYANVTRD